MKWKVFQLKFLKGCNCYPKDFMKHVLHYNMGDKNYENFLEALDKERKDKKNSVRYYDCLIDNED